MPPGIFIHASFSRIKTKAFLSRISVIADTIAFSSPHEEAYHARHAQEVGQDTIYHALMLDACTTMISLLDMMSEMPCDFSLRLQADTHARAIHIDEPALPLHIFNIHVTGL